MALFFSLLPFYLLGNVHCASMCGPLVALLAKNPHRHLYFLGRFLSFSLAGLLAAEVGITIHALLNPWHLGAFCSLFFGAIVLIIGVGMLAKIRGPIATFLAKKSAPLAQKLASLVQKEGALPTFWFGFLTIALPCGQTVAVFSALALTGKGWIGLLHGALFALSTSPSLYFAMHFGKKIRLLAPKLLGVTTLVIGALLVLRGLAHLEVVEHAVISSKWHVVLF